MGAHDGQLDGLQVQVGAKEGYPLYVGVDEKDSVGVDVGGRCDGEHAGEQLDGLLVGAQEEASDRVNDGLHVGEDTGAPVI